MKRAALWAVLAVALAWGQSGDRARVRRPAIAPMEKSFDQRLERMFPDEAFLLLGTTRGVYLENFGVVFTAEFTLVASPGMTPFRGAMKPEEIARLRVKKLERLPKLRETMREMLMASAASLDPVPADEQVVVGVTLFHYSWEDTSGLPAQIVMQAARRELLASKTPEIRVREF